MTPNTKNDPFYDFFSLISSEIFNLAQTSEIVLIFLFFAAKKIVDFEVCKYKTNFWNSRLLISVQ